MTLVTKLVAVCFFIFSSGFIVAVQANAVPKLAISIAHESKNELRLGESFWYAFNLTHTPVSNADAKDIQITWYIPHYLRFGQISGALDGVQVNVDSDVVVFKKPSLMLGNTANVKFEASLVNSSEITQGHHYAVTMTGLQWHSSAAVKYTNPLQSYSMEFVVPGCSSALGMESGKIKSHQLIASSSLPSSRPDMARFSQDAWCAQQQDGNQFIQVIFAKKVKITKIVTKGRSLKPHWVKEYTIRYSVDNIKWILYKENGFEKVFKGNSDLNSPVSHWLLYPVSANYIRIHPKSWNTQICMRFELYGCQISQSDNCIDPIGMETGEIPDGALSDSAGSSASAVNARLNKNVVSFPFGWAPTNTDPSIQHWIQADLGSVHKITSTAIQGSNNEPVPLFYVKSYELQFSNNSIDWIIGNNSETEKLYKGPQSSDAAKFPMPAFFSKPVFARFVRLIPREFNSMQVLRMELYGCVSEERPTLAKAELPAEFNRRSILLDKETNTLYLCIYKEDRAAMSCRMTSDGKRWKGMGSKVVNILGYDPLSKVFYGLDHHMSYMYTQDGGRIWKFISKKEWQRHQLEGAVTLSTKINDILVGKNPSMNWTASTGHIWGVSGEGVHLMEAGSSWNLVASWKCCGF